MQHVLEAYRIMFSRARTCFCMHACILVAPLSQPLPLCISLALLQPICTHVFVCAACFGDLQTVRPYLMRSRPRLPADSPSTLLKPFSRKHAHALSRQLRLPHPTRASMCSDSRPLYSTQHFVSLQKQTILMSKKIQQRSCGHWMH